MGEQTRPSEGNEREPFVSLDSIKSRSKESSITKRYWDSEAAGFNPSVKKTDMITFQLMTQKKGNQAFIFILVPSQ
jgi:hypothetical protein